MRFVKMHGLGNDFVVLDEPVELDGPAVAALCDRRFGIGADGLLAVGRRGSAVTMRYWNADGSPAEMCGNGLRCVARHAVDAGLVAGPELVVVTPLGERRAFVAPESVTVDMGTVVVDAADDTVAGVTLRRVSVGNPHAVVEVEDVDAVALGELGPRLQPFFPAGVNVEVVARVDEGTVRMRVWERGVGETLACGTGMVAAAAVAGGEAVEVRVPGGSGTVSFAGDAARLTGPVVTVFRGELSGGGGGPRRPSP